MSPLQLRALTAAHAAATFFALAPSALAAKGVPAQPEHGENTPLDLPSSTPKTADPTGATGGGSLVRTFVGLAVVVAVIYGLYWVLRQVKASREERNIGHGLSSEA